MASMCDGNFPAALFDAQTKSAVCASALKQEARQFVWISTDCQGFSQSASSSTAQRLCQEESKARGGLGTCREVDIYAADACNIKEPSTQQFLQTKASAPDAGPIMMSTKNPNCVDKMKAPPDWCGHQGWPSSASAKKIYDSYCNHRRPVEHYLVLDKQCAYVLWNKNWTRGVTECAEHAKTDCYIFDCDQFLCTAEGAVGVPLHTTTTTTPGSAFDCLGGTCPEWTRSCNKYRYCDTTGEQYLAISTDCADFMGHGTTKDDALAACRARGAKSCTVVDTNRKLCPTSVWILPIIILVGVLLACCCCLIGCFFLWRSSLNNDSKREKIREAPPGRATSPSGQLKFTVAGNQKDRASKATGRSNLTTARSRKDKKKRKKKKVRT